MINKVKLRTTLWGLSGGNTRTVETGVLTMERREVTRWNARGCNSVE